MILPQISNTNIPSVASFGPELPYITTKLIGAVLGPGLATMKRYMSTAKIYGVRKVEVLTNDYFAASSTTNPSNTWYWSFRMESMDGATNMTKHWVSTITYYCEFYNRIQVAAS